MLVYGDLQFRTGLSGFVRALRCLAAESWQDSLAQQRTLLIRLGQLEQGLFDFHEPRGHDAGELQRMSAALTDTAAESFLNSMQGQSAEAPANLERLRAELAEFPTDVDTELEIKVPEGFEFYTLYPEQYLLAAAKWVQASRPHEPCNILVVGIRSIGTSLSALVLAALRRGGCKVARTTIRPSGHPFSRQAHLPAPVVGRADCGLIVDEGPGLSGSSMAAAEEALRSCGVERISFLPGHGGMPGPAATPQVRALWERTPRFFVPHSDLRWGARSCVDELSAATADYFGTSLSQVEAKDLSAGDWRDYAYSDSAEWPAVCPAFERTKYLCRAPDGRALLWKFDGLGSAEADTGRGRGGGNGVVRSVVPKLFVLGFAGTEWIKGVRLRSEEGQGLWPVLWDYLVRSAGPSLRPSSQAEAVARLCEMLEANAGTLVGSDAAAALCSGAAAAADLRDGPSYTDGRMAPHEWVRAADGTIWKTDSTGHNRDHTLVGPQSLLWDLAGTLVEWGFDASRPSLSDAALSRFGCGDVEAALRFYIGAYAAFRAGMVALGETSAAGPGDALRLARQRAAYTMTLRRATEAGAAVT